YPLTIKDHKPTHVLFNGSVYKDENGNVLGAVVVARDITEQREKEYILQKTLKELSDYKYALDASSIVEVTDKYGVIKFVNDNFCKISQYTASELVGNTHLVTSSGFHSKLFMTNLWETISSGKIWKSEMKNKAKDGTFYWVLTTIVPFLDIEGIPYQYVAIRSDITEQKRIEQEINEAKEHAELATSFAEEAQSKAEEAVKSKQQFLSNMSHEIRTPMNAIIGFTKVLLKTELSAKQLEYLNAIKMSGDALIVLINDILDLAKVDAGKMSFEKIPFKLASSIASMLHLFETKIQEKNLRLVKEYDTRIPEVLLGDPVRLHQIILNLVSNAVKFTSTGTITVSIRQVEEDEEKVTIEFSVKDTGIGIAASKMERIFDNFQQASSETSRIFGGTGLGLSIVKQLVEPQGGTIRVESEPNVGSRFSFTLSFLKTDGMTEVIDEIMEDDTEIKNVRVLVVEDMALNQLLMRTLLDDFGFYCDIVSNGKLAIEKLAIESYDIILMDLQMPEMNGFEATKYIRNDLKLTIPIIALTADVTTVDLAKCKEVGMNDYIAKPVDDRFLYSKIVGLVKNFVPEKELITEKIKYTDLSYLIHRTKANPILIKEMISLYLAQTPPLILSMKQSLRDKDWVTLGSAVHKMIPSFAIMGIKSNYEKMARQVQEYAVSQQLSVEIHDLVYQLENACGQACEELKEELEKLTTTNNERQSKNDPLSGR
ncbi:MAG: ATP-binding protein, partial [Spirosomataceae bacterium]